MGRKKDQSEAGTDAIDSGFDPGQLFSSLGVDRGIKPATAEPIES